MAQHPRALSAFKRHASTDIAVVETAECRCSTCPEEQTCLIKLLGYIFATTPSKDHQHIIKWCTEKLGMQEMMSDEADHWMHANEESTESIECAMNTSEAGCMCRCAICKKEPSRDYLKCDCCNAPLCLNCTEYSGKVHDLGDHGDFCDTCFNLPDKGMFQKKTPGYLHDPGCPDRR